MARKFIQYFKDRDSLGFAPQMTYKGKHSHGTFFGGCCSCVATILVLAYVATVMNQFVFQNYTYKSSAE